MNDHKEHIDEIAQAAAVLYGQNWATLGYEIKQRWRETVRHIGRGSVGVNQMETCAGQAIDEWYKKREAAPVVVETAEASEAPPKQKSKKK